MQPSTTIWFGKTSLRLPVAKEKPALRQRSWPACGRKYSKDGTSGHSGSRNREGPHPLSPPSILVRVVEWKERPLLIILMLRQSHRERCGLLANGFSRQQYIILWRFISTSVSKKTSCMCVKTEAVFTLHKCQGFFIVLVVCDGVSWPISCVNSSDC